MRYFELFSGTGIGGMALDKFGFKNVAVRKRYYSNGEDAYLMIKELEG